MQAFTSVNCPLTGDEAKTLFTNLRNKYTRDKKKIDGKKVSGAGTDEVTQAVKEASEIYPFMKWLEPYIKPRKTVSYYKPVGVEEEFNDDTEEESRPITPTPSETDSDVPSNSSGTSRYCGVFTVPFIRISLDCFSENKYGLLYRFVLLCYVDK